MSGDQNGTDRIGTTGLRSVAQVLRDDRPTAAEAVGLAAATAAEVAALHAAGRVHGHLDPETVLIDDRGDAVLSGPTPQRIGPAAPPELVFADLRAVGRILALGLGWAVPDRRLPVPVEDLLTRAEAAGTPSMALALALRRLQRDPALVATLLPPVATAVPARPRQDAGPLAALVPLGARRTTGVAAGFVAGIALVGGALLLVGAPASTGLAPRNAGRIVAAPQAAAASPAPFEDTSAIKPDPTSIEKLLRTSRTAAPVPAAPRRVQAAAPVARPRVQAAGPVAPSRPASSAPSSGSSGGTTKPTSAPAPSTPPSSAPSAPTGTPSAPPAPAPPAPVPSAPAPAPAPTHVVPSAPTVSSAPSAPAPARTGTPTAG